MSVDYARFFAALCGGGVEFILVGGTAANVHGSARLTQDVDILYRCGMPRPAFAAADSARRPIFTTYPPTLEMTGGRPFHEVGRWARGGLWRIESAAKDSGTAP